MERHAGHEGNFSLGVIKLVISVFVGVACGVADTPSCTTVNEVNLAEVVRGCMFRRVTRDFQLRYVMCTLTNHQAGGAPYGKLGAGGENVGNRRPCAG